MRADRRNDPGLDRSGRLDSSARADESDLGEVTAVSSTMTGSSEPCATAPDWADETCPGDETALFSSLTMSSHPSTTDSGGSVAYDSRDFPIHRFGDYELIKVLGQGGMGIVYLARQLSLGRLVALKMLRAGLLAGDNDLRRFRNEAKAIAQLDHPHLLTIFEVGEYDGRCYFTMPLINGGSLADHPSRYLDHPRRAALLVADIAGAIHHAHQRGILHRDLKPANVLIDEAGRPHVSDFGLAKRLGDDDTPTGAILGTPAYMSPEQASGCTELVTTSSDIYGLGAILYSLLTGRSPFTGGSAVEILRRVCDEGLERPSKLNPLVDRGLEAICLKSLEKEPKRRYASAEAFADDLVRWLEGLPIAARPAGPTTLFWMWCRRKPALAGMSLALAVLTIAGTAGIVANWLDVRYQKELLALANTRTERERDFAETLNEFLLEDLLHRSSPLGAPTRAVSVEDLLDRSARTVESRFVGRPAVEASIRRVLADAYRATGRLDKADAQITACLKIMSGAPDVDERERLAAWHALGGLLLAKDNAKAAMRYAHMAHEGRNRILGAADVDSLDSANLLVSVNLALGQVQRAEDLANRTYEAASEAHGAGHRITLCALGNLGVIAHRLGRLADAEESLKIVREARIPLLGPDHPETLHAESNLAAVVLARGRAAEAESLLSRALGASRQVLGEGHHLTLTIANNLAAAQSQLGKLDEAGASLVAVIEGRESVLGETHTDTMMARNNLAANLADRGRFVEALALLDGVVPHLRANLPPGDPRLAAAILNQAGSLQGAGQIEEAEARAEEAVALARKLPGQGGSTTEALARQAAILLDARKFDRAEILAREVLAARVSTPGTAPWKVAIARSMLGSALAGKGDVAGGGPLLLAGYAGVRDDPRATPAAVLNSIERIASMYEESGFTGLAALWRDVLGNRQGP